MSGKRRKVYEMTVDEWNEKVAELDLYEIPYELEINTFMIKAKTKACVYKASLSDKFNEEINPAVISKEFSKMTKYHYLDTDKLYGYKKLYLGNTLDYKVKWGYKTAVGYSWCDKLNVHKDLKCWSYDINSSFPYAMLQPMPDTTKEPRYNDFVKENEIGFYLSSEATTKIGDYADIIFPLMESPFKEYITKYYSKKENSSGLEREKWKLYLNIPTGCIQRHNIFIRNAIIHYSNEYIKKYIDDDTVYCNIDCIVSLKPRNDLPIGNDIGLFKEEHSNLTFRYIDCGIYQWIDDNGNKEIHYRGINDKCIKDIENTTGWYELYKDNLDYIYDKEKRRIVKNGKKETLC